MNSTESNDHFSLNKKKHPYATGFLAAFIICSAIGSAIGTIYIIMETKYYTILKYPFRGYKKHPMKQCKNKCFCNYLK